MAKNAKLKIASDKIETKKHVEETQPIIEAKQDLDEDQSIEDVEEDTDETEQSDTDASTYVEPPIAKPIIPDNGYSRLMQFPAEVTLPMHVVVDIGADNRRYQILSDGQKVPKAIIDWLKRDARYMRWFAQ